MGAVINTEVGVPPVVVVVVGRLLVDFRLLRKHHVNPKVPFSIYLCRTYTKGSKAKYTAISMSAIPVNTLDAFDVIPSCAIGMVISCGPQQTTKMIEI